MKDLKKQTKFIELRATGKSYADISLELKVSKNTLVAWSKTHKFEIANLKTMELEALQRRLKMNEEGRLEMFGNMLSRLQEEFSKRDLSSVPTEKLVDQIAKISSLILERYKEANFLEQAPFCSHPDTWPA